MYDYDLGVVAENRYLSTYEVFCNRCGVSIGVMDFQTIRSAVFSTYQRGGVLCPDCRKRTCDVCGDVAADFGLSIVEGPKGKVRACLVCEDSINELDRQVKYQICDPSPDQRMELDDVLF